MQDTTHTVKNFITNNKLIAKGDVVVALNSFGKDSSALVHTLNRLKDDIGFEFRCVNIQYAKHIFSDKKEVKGILDFWKKEGVEIRTIKIPDSITDVNDVHGGEKPCSKCKRVRRHFIKEEIEGYLKDQDRITIATGHNLWDLLGYITVVEIQTGFFQSKPRNADYICEVLGRFPPKMDFGKIRLVRPLLAISDTDVQRYLLDPDYGIERLTSTCNYRMERPKRKVAEYTVFLEDGGLLNVSYEGLMRYVKKMGVLDYYAPKIRKIPWDVFTV